MPHLFWPAVFLEPEKSFLVHTCYSQCISASCDEFAKCFPKKNRNCHLSLSFARIRCMSHSSRKQSSLLCILSLLWQTIMWFVFSTFNLICSISNLWFMLWLQVSLGLLHARATHILWPPQRWQKLQPMLPPERKPLQREEEWSVCSDGTTLEWSLNRESCSVYVIIRKSFASCALTSGAISANTCDVFMLKCHFKCKGFFWWFGYFVVYYFGFK